MPNIHILGTNLNYDETNLINLEEGLIGIPQLRKMVLINQTDIEPFLWFASVDFKDIAFLVIEPSNVLPNYRPEITTDVRNQIGLNDDEQPVVLAISRIDGNWTDSTMNLRAPIFLNSRTMRGVQAILNDTSYSFDHPLPVEQAVTTSTAEPV
jgi:flagellar assembly factor FliW